MRPTQALRSGSSGRHDEHRGRLIKNENAALEVELLEDLAFLPLAGRDRQYLGVHRDAERHALEKGFELRLLLLPVDDGRKLRARQHEVLRHRHGGYRSEMLIDHAEPERVRGVRIFNYLLSVADYEFALVCPIISHDAFDQRRLAGAVFAEQGVEAASGHFQRYLVEGGKGTEAFGHGQGLEAKRLHRNDKRRSISGRCGQFDGHAIASINAVELDTAPKTPPCILIILIAWS
jgi:hypothetical protein